MAPEETVVCTVHSPEQTDRLARLLAELLPDGTTIALVGTLGAGKTRLVQGVAAALGIAREEVTSPTFVLCQEYHGRRTLYHLDAYRVRGEDEFLELGSEEYFQSPAITMVEWADRVSDCLPPERIEIRIEVAGPKQRELSISSTGPQYRPVVQALGHRLQAEFGRGPGPPPVSRGSDSGGAESDD